MKWKLIEEVSSIIKEVATLPFNGADGGCLVAGLVSSFSLWFPIEHFVDGCGRSVVEGFVYYLGCCLVCHLCGIEPS